MKFLMFIATLLLANIAFAANVVTDPAATQTIAPTAAGVISLQIDNTGTASNTEMGLFVKNTGSSTKPAIGAESVDWDGVSGKSINGVGVYGSSFSFYGMMGESAQESSGYFSSSSSQNTKPTLLIQSITGSANLFEVQSISSTKLMAIDSNGAIQADSGIRLPSSGSCDASHRRFIKVLEGGAGVADKLQVCLKNSGGSYVWVTK